MSFDRCRIGDSVKRFQFTALLAFLFPFIASASTPALQEVLPEHTHPEFHAREEPEVNLIYSVNREPETPFDTSRSVEVITSSDIWRKGARTLPEVLVSPGQELAKLLGKELPPDAMPSKQYVGTPRLFLPEVRTCLLAGETLTLKVILLGAQPQDAAVYWRPLGTGQFTMTPLVHVARGVYAATLSDEAVKADFEYYVKATVGVKSLVFPATAPRISQTVVVVE